jgi:hypothetical protein
MTRTEFSSPPLKHFGNLVMMVAAFIALGFAMMNPPRGLEKDALYLGIFMVFLLYGMVSFARMPYRISLRDGNMVLRSVVRSATVAPDEVSAISTQSFGYYVHIDTRRGTFVVLKSFDGLRELVAWLRERNPALIVSGL